MLLAYIYEKWPKTQLMKGVASQPNIQSFICLSNISRAELLSVPGIHKGKNDSGINLSEFTVAHWM